MTFLRSRLNQIQRRIDRLHPKVCLSRSFREDIPEKSEEEIIAEYERANNVKVDPERVLWFNLRYYDHRHLDKIYGLGSKGKGVESNRNGSALEEPE